MQAHSTNAAVKIPAYIEALEITLALRWKICIDQSFLFVPAGTSGSKRNDSRRLANILFETGNYSSSEPFANQLFKVARKFSGKFFVARSRSVTPRSRPRQKTMFGMPMNRRSFSLAQMHHQQAGLGHLFDRIAQAFAAETRIFHAAILHMVDAEAGHV